MRAHDGRQAREASRCLPREGPQAFRWCAAMHMAAFDRSATTELIKLGATASECLVLQWTRALKRSTRRALLPRHTRARARHARAARLCCAIYAFLSNVASARSDAAEADAARRGRGGQRVGVAARRMDDARCLVSSSTAERHVATVETETVARYKARRATAGSCEDWHSVCGAAHARGCIRSYVRPAPRPAPARHM